MASRGIPFIGEDGFYPNWAKGSTRWVFQRTLVSLGGIFADYAELAAQSVPASDQVIVWVPVRRGLATLFATGALHRERELAIEQLARLRLKCYGADCGFAPRSLSVAKVVVHETGVHPKEWRLVCPRCGGVVGPDLACVRPEPIVAKWDSAGRIALDNPCASTSFRSAPNICDLPGWIRTSDPSHLELAYVGQQMWPELDSMLDDLVNAA